MNDFRGFIRISWVVAVFAAFSSIVSLETRADCSKTELNGLEVVSPALQEMIRKSFDPLTRIASGGYRGSGGEGLVCFASRADAESAVDPVSGKLLDQARSKITRVSAYDVVKYRYQYMPVPPAKGESPEDYLERSLDEGIGADLPAFSKAIKEIIHGLSQNGSLQSWNDAGALPKLSDGERDGETPEKKREEIGSIYEVKDGNTPPKTEYCRRVQVAIRYSEEKPTGKWPKFFIDADGDLLKRMGEGPSWADNILFPAAIRSHEYFYMAASVLGMKDSTATQEFVSIIFAKNVFNEIRSWPVEHRARLWRERIEKLGFTGLSELLKAPHQKTDRISKEGLRQSWERRKQIEKEARDELGLPDDNRAPRGDDFARFVEKYAEKASPDVAFIFSLGLMGGFSREVPFSAGIFFEDGVNNTHHYKIACQEIHRRIGAVPMHLRTPMDIAGTKMLEKGLEHCRAISPGFK